MQTYFKKQLKFSLVPIYQVLLFNTLANKKNYKKKRHSNEQRFYIYLKTQLSVFNFL